MATRVAKKTLVNVSLADAQTAAHEYAKTMLQKEKLTAVMNEKLQALREKYEPEITTLETELEQPAEVLKTFALENKSKWEAKSLELASCTIGFRTNPPSVAKSKKVTWDYLVSILKNSKLLKPFVRTKEEIDKAAILKTEDTKVLAKLAEVGIEIEQTENFYITPKADKAA
jgi:phage host-nuclease inhibitor protein Gam